MGLKAFAESLDDIPEQFRDLYKQTDEGFVIDVDDKDYKAKISEFRDNNIALRQQADKAQSMKTELEKLRNIVKDYKDIDPTKAREALSKLHEMEEKNLMDAGKLDEVVASRTERMRQDYEGKLQAMQSQFEEVNGKANKFADLYSKTVIESGLQRAVADVAVVRPGAITDIIARGRGVWTVDEDGNPVPRDQDGKVRYGKDGKEPITMQEWAEGLLLDAPYLFEGSAGGGSAGGRGEGGAKKRVAMDDQESINNNLEAIAMGKVEVVNN